MLRRQKAKRNETPWLGRCCEGRSCCPQSWVWLWEAHFPIMERLIYEFDCHVEVTILTWKWLQIRSVPQFLYICQFLGTPSISTCTSVFCWILSRWQWPPWLGLSITFSIKNPVSGNPGYGNDNLGGWTCPLLKPSQQRILDALLWIVFEVFLSTRVNTFFKKKRKRRSKDRSNYLRSSLAFAHCVNQKGKMCLIPLSPPCLGDISCWESSEECGYM